MPSLDFPGGSDGKAPVYDVGLYLTTLLGQMREEEGMVAPEFLPHASLHALQQQF